MKRKKAPKVRNRTAVAAWNKTGAGPHKDRKRASKQKEVKEDLDEE